jgi:hypothetical protein
LARPGRRGRDGDVVLTKVRWARRRRREVFDGFASRGEVREMGRRGGKGGFDEEAWEIAGSVVSWRTRSIEDVHDLLVQTLRVEREFRG